MRAMLDLRILVVSIAAATLSASALGAQTAAPAAAAAAAPTAGQMAAARELLRAMDLERTTMGGVDAMLNAQFGSNPAAAPYVDVARAWAKKYMTWEVMGERMARVYADAFTEPELREMVAFYRTPTGQKLARVSPDLMQRGAEVGASVAREHQAELAQMIQARHDELEKQSGKPQ